MPTPLARGQENSFAPQMIFLGLRKWFFLASGQGGGQMMMTEKWWDNNDDDNNDDGEACKSLLRPFCISTVVRGTSLLFCSAAGVWPWECSWNSAIPLARVKCTATAKCEQSVAWEIEFLSGSSLIRWSYDHVFLWSYNHFDHMTTEAGNSE